MNVYRKRVEKLWKTALFGTTSLQKGKKMQTWMESKHPDVKFILEALVGSLTALTAEGDLLLDDKNSQPLKNTTLAVATPINSFLSEIHQEKSIVSSDSMLCLAQADEKSSERRHTSKGINDRFLDFAFIFNAGITFRRLFDNIGQKCTPEKFSHRIIFLSMKEE